MKMKNKEKIGWLEILFWIVIIALFIMILTRIFGNSATDIQIYLGFITSLITIMIFIAKHYRETGEIKRDIKYNFLRVKEDMKRIESKIDDLLINWGN